MQSILESQHSHADLMRRVMRDGERVAIALYDGSIAHVCGYSQWDEGVCVSQAGRTFMYRARFTEVAR
jgi:hypothetical protein